MQLLTRKYLRTAKQALPW